MSKIELFWDSYSDEYFDINNIEKMIEENINDPSVLFHPDTISLLKKHCKSLKNKKVCVLASGDNLDVLLLSLLGAKVTSIDISEKQLINAKKIADSHDLEIDFICSDIKDLSTINDKTYDIVYTSNGVFVWLNNLDVVFSEIHRILVNKGIYIFREVHPFQRPWKDQKLPLEMIKSYYDIGPFGQLDNYHWKVEDVINSLISSGLNIIEVKESKSVDDSFWESPNYENRTRITKEHQEWEINNLAGLPVWLGMACIRA